MMRLTIIGFGNQAQSWAQNLKDSNFPVRVALKAQSHSISQAKKLGFDYAIAPTVKPKDDFIRPVTDLRSALQTYMTNT